MKACSLCGDTRWEILEQAGAARVVRCACGLAFVTPQPARPAIERTYDAAYYAAWERQSRRRSRIWQDRLERVESLASPPGRLLDVGCATGAFLRVAQARGWTVTGTELSPQAVRAAQADGFRVFPGEVWEAGLSGEAFDAVTCWHVIEHVTDPRRVMDEIHRVLRPGGWLVLATPNLDDYIFRAAYLVARRRRVRLFEPDERELHLFFFSAQTLRRLAEAAGFTVAAIRFDRGAAAVWGKQLVDGIAYALFRLSGQHWGMALELVARKPGGTER